MGSIIRLVDSKFFAQLNNGDDFTLNASDFATHLKGGILERVKAVLTVQADWNTYLSTFDVIVDVVGSATIRITDNSADYDSDGFSIGDSVKWSLNDGTNPSIKYTGVVTSITGGEMIIGSVVLVAGSLSDGVHSYQSQNSFITGLTDLTALKYKFGLIENNEFFNTLSKLTNIDLLYTFEGIDHGVPGTWANGLAMGNNKAGFTGSSRVNFSQLVLDRDLIFNEVTAQEFVIEHIFRVIPVFRDGELLSLTGADVPPLDIFNGNLSLKYVFETEFRTVVNNPNTSKTAELDTLDGSIGYLGESFNGFTNDYSVSDLVYFNVTDSIAATKIDVTKLTRITFSINSATSTISAGMPLVVKHTAILDSTKYTNSPLDYDTLWNSDSVRNIEGAGATAGNIISAFTCTIINATQLDVTFEVSYSAAQIALIDDQQHYLLGYNIQDATKVVDTGDKVVDRIDVNQYDKSSDIAGLFEVINLWQYAHPNDVSGVGFTDGKCFIEDGMMLGSLFRILNEHESADVNLDAIKFKIVAFNTVTNEWFDIRELNLDLSSQVLVGNIQNINLNSTRGYILKDSDVFNFLKLTTEVNSVNEADFVKVIANTANSNHAARPCDNGYVFSPTTLTTFEVTAKSAEHNLFHVADAFNGAIDVRVDLDTGILISDLPSNTTVITNVGNGFWKISIEFTTGANGLLATMVGHPPGAVLTTNDTVYIGDDVSGVYVMNTGLLHTNGGTPLVYTCVEIQVAVNFSFISLYKVYSLQIGYKIPWQDWIKLLSADTIFYDVTKSLNGLNNNSSNYSFSNDYKIRMLIDANVSTGGITTNYIDTSGNFEAYNHDTDDLSPDGYTCDISTHDINGIALASNIISQGHTELRAVFTPDASNLPTLTTNVDFTEVSTLWGRFAHGNLYTNRIGVWANEQGNDTDLFLDGTGGGSKITKLDAGLYASTVSQITTLFNADAYYGAFSINEYEYYQLTGTKFSTDTDNDCIGFVLALFTDDNGVEHTFSLVTIGGGVNENINPATSPTVNTFLTENTDFKSCLIYNFGKSDWKVLSTFNTGKTGLGWNAVGDLDFKVVRTGNDFTIDLIDWIIGGTTFNHTFNYNLTDNTETEIFIGLSHIGFGWQSQFLGGFKDVVLVDPLADFYAILRIEGQDSASDFEISELSTIIEAPTNSLLKQITGPNRLSTLSWNGTSFYVQGLIETASIVSGATFKYSALLRDNNLEV